MPGDELHDEALRAAAGPRHAAPRKPLLTRLHLPAGRAIAMAAMPTAVLMTMGLTPQLAAAQPQPESPFADGPCVSAPDRSVTEEERDNKAADDRDASGSTKDGTKDGTEGGTKGGIGGERAPGGAQQPSESPSSGEPVADGPAREAERRSTSSVGAAEAGSPEDEPSQEERSRLDLPGLGDVVRDLLGIDGRKRKADAESPAEEPSSGPSASASPVEKRAGAAEGVEEVKGAEDALDAAEERSRSAVEQGGRTGEQEGESTGRPRGRDGTDREKGPGDAEPEAAEPAPTASGTAEADKDGKQPFPCVEEKKVPGEDERTPVVLPSQPWHLEATSLTLRGLEYHGVVNVTMANGKTKQALKFTSESIDIGDLHQLVNGPDGIVYHIEAGKGTTSTIRGGTVTMYTEKLAANLFGVLPIVFDPEHPPPLDLPFAHFTEVKLRQAGQFGGNLSVPQLQQHISH